MSTATLEHDLAVSAPSPAKVSPRALFFLVVVALATAASGFEDARLDVGDLLVHPYLLPIALAFPFVFISDAKRLPRTILNWSILAGTIYAVALFNDPDAISEFAKVSASAVTIITVALVARDERALTLGTLGLALGVAFLSLRGMSEVESEAVGAMMLDVGNKNAFSLYALPALLLAGHVWLSGRTRGLMRVTLMATILVTVVGIFSTGNRSGWLGTIMVGFLLMGRGKSARTLGTLAVVGSLAYIGLTSLSSTAAFERKWEQTVEGNESDGKRLELFLGSMEVALENPVLGAGPEGLAMELARKVDAPARKVDSHNVIAYIAGALGIPLLLTFGALGISLWVRVRQNLSVSAREAHGLLRQMILLWLMRGLFTREVLYTPTFCVGFGLILGLCMEGGVWTREPAATDHQPEPRPPASHLQSTLT